MAGRKPQLDPSKRVFLAELVAATNLVAAIQAVPSSIRPSATPALHPKYKIQVVELAFMGVVAAWEEFLEATLVRYVAGAKTASGYTPIPKYGLASSLAHSYNVLSGKENFNQGSDYLKVSDPSWVKNKANFVFSIHPYGCLTTKAAVLNAASKIRNRVAHSSNKCKAEFKVVALQFLNLPANGTLRQSFTAGDLLLAPTTSNFGMALPGGLDHFGAFAHIYTGLAHAIVP